MDGSAGRGRRRAADLSESGEICRAQGRANRTGLKSQDLNCLSELGMRPVAQGLLGRMFTPTGEHFFAGLSGVFDRLERAAFVGAIAERLPLRLAAGAPEIAFPFFDLDGNGRVLGDDRGLRHVATPSFG